MFALLERFTNSPTTFYDVAIICEKFINILICVQEEGEATTLAAATTNVPTTAAPVTAAPAADKEATTTAEVIIKQINEINEDGSYTVGKLD